jgi:hypothetical protein
MSSSVAAQHTARSIGILATHSLSSRTSAAPPPCLGCGPVEDVLSSLTLSTVELELAIPLRREERAGLEYTVRAVPLELLDRAASRSRRPLRCS